MRSLLIYPCLCRLLLCLVLTVVRPWKRQTTEQTHHK